MEDSSTKTALGCLFLILIIIGVVQLIYGNSWGFAFFIGGIVIWGLGYIKSDSTPTSNEGLSGYGTVDEIAALAKIHAKQPDVVALKDIDFDEISPNENEVEYRIVGINYRNLAAKDIGYSDKFSIKADKGNAHDKYAVEIYNARGSLSGYLERPDNKFWFKFLLYAKPNAPQMDCRGYIDTFVTDEGKQKYYGKIYLPQIEEDEDYHKIMNS